MHHHGVPSGNLDDEADVEILSTNAFILQKVLSGGLPSEWFKAGLRIMPWWRCEGKAFLGGDEECEKLKDGQDLMECGRVSVSQ